jgi:hypothetical protein
MLTYFARLVRLMRRVISSGWTFVFKLLVPLTLVSLSIFLVLGLFAYSPQPPTDALIGTLLTVVATAFFCWWGARLKWVSLDVRNLYASNWIKEISIPLSEIDAVDASQGGWPVSVRLKARSEFGCTIFFLATWRPSLFSRTHPILDELRQLMNQKQNG